MANLPTITEADRSEIQNRIDQSLNYILNGSGAFPPFPDDHIEIPPPSPLLPQPPPRDLLDKFNNPVSSDGQHGEPRLQVHGSPEKTSDMVPQYHPETGVPLRFSGGSPVIGPAPEQQPLGGVFKYYGKEMPSLTAQELAALVPDWLASPDSGPNPTNPDATPAAASGVRRLTRVSWPAYGDSNPRDPTPAPTSQAGRPLGLVTGLPMRDWPVPPPLGGFSNRSGDESQSQTRTGIPFLDEYIPYLSQT